MAGDYFKKFAPAATTCHHRLLQQNLPIADIAVSLDHFVSCQENAVRYRDAKRLGGF